MYRVCDEHWLIDKPISVCGIDAEVNRIMGTFGAGRFGGIMVQVYIPKQARLVDLVHLNSDGSVADQPRDVREAITRKGE